MKFALQTLLSTLTSIKKDLFLISLFDLIGLNAIISTLLEVVFLCKMILLLLTDLFVNIEVIEIHLSIDSEVPTVFISSIAAIA